MALETAADSAPRQVVEPTFYVFALNRTSTALDKFSERFQEAKRHPEDAATVHDLRVAIRRFVQALRTFEQLFDPTHIERTEQQFKKLMKACGDKRNTDVAPEVLRDSGVPPDDPTHAHLKKQRKRAEKELIRRLSKKSWLKLAKRAAAPQHKPRGSISAYARTLLPEMWSELLTAGEAALAVPDDYKMLHHFRILGKKLRYTLELFEGLKAADVTARLAALRKLQDHLGKINDRQTTLKLIAKYPRAQASVRKSLDRCNRNFSAYWQRAFAKQTRTIRQNSRRKKTA